MELVLFFVVTVEPSQFVPMVLFEIGGKTSRSGDGVAGEEQTWSAQERRGGGIAAGVVTEGQDHEEGPGLPLVQQRNE